jgi:DNA-binding beta-propeller fold protein YncE
VSDHYPTGSGEFPVGAQIAGYRLEEQIGRGGMAVVYRALDTRLDRHVALKILAPGLALDDAFRQRFIRESRAAAAVDHPHIIPVFEAGEADGVLFIAMRYVHGGDVRSLLDTDGPLPVVRAADVITQVASALDAAHSHGLVHRDVKPGNMLLDSTSGSGRQDHVYLSDFGLSKQSLAVSGLTSTGQFLGTLDYVAPEQIEGRPVDGRTDLYALACASFEILCGTPPFRRDQGLAVVWAQLAEPPPSLCARRADLPVAVDAVLAKAMAKAPADRYPTCLAFAAALREALGLLVPGSAAPVGPEGGPPAGGPAAGAAPGSLPEPRAHPPTEISTPSRAAAAGAGETAAAASGPGTGPGTESGARSDARSAAKLPAEPPTEGFRTSRPTTPGQTEQASYPSGQASYPPSGRAGYPPPAGYGGHPPDAQDGYPQRRRPWWRSPAAVIIACVVVLGAAGGAFAALHGSGGGGGGGAGGGTTAAAVLPGCGTAVASAPALPKVQTATVSVGGNPFTVQAAPGGTYSFVTLGNSIAVLKDGGSLAPKVFSTFPAPGAKRGEAITPNGKYLLAAAGSGAMVINVADAEQGSASPITGVLTSPYGKGAVEVAISPNSKFAFVTLQDSADMVVFNLASALTNGFGPSDIVGRIKLGQQPVGMAISPDGNWLYATSMARTKTPHPSEGTITVINLHRAEAKPSSAITSVVTAGCSPVRLLASGSDVWVTSRESDTLLCFSATSLRTNPAHSLIARVNVGAAPLGVVMVRNGSRILVANSDLHNQPGASSSIAVISTSAALAGGHALLGLIATGLVPREFALDPGGKTVLVTNSNSGSVQAVDVGSLP